LCLTCEMYIGCRILISQEATGINVAFDYPTLRG